MIYLAAEKNSADVLRMHAERNPEIQDILLQKAKFQETKHASVTDKEEYKKILNQVDSVLSQVEKELQSHTEGRALTLLRILQCLVNINRTTWCAVPGHSIISQYFYE